MKRFFSILLTVLLVCSAFPAAMAEMANFDQESYEVTVGESFTAYVNADTTELSYESEDGGSKLQCSAFSNTAVLYNAIAEGITTISVKSGTTVLDTATVTIKPAPLKVEHTSATLTVGDAPFDPVPNHMTGVTWTSDNSAVASVDAVSGMITAAGAGETDIRGTDLTGTVTCHVKVVPVLAVSPKTLSLKVGENQTLSCTRTDATWSSLNTSVATVNAATGEVTAVSAGEATIVASADAKSDVCTVTVTKELTLSLAHNQSTYLTRENNEFTVHDGDGNVVTTATVTSSDNDVAYMADATHLMTGSKAGTATITAEQDGKTATLNVQVLPEPTSVKLDPTSITLNEGSTYAVSPTIPTGSATRYTYQIISGSGVVTVDESGIVTGKKAGDATIQVSTHNGCTAALTVKVIVPAEMRYVSFSKNPVSAGTVCRVIFTDKNKKEYTATSYTSSNTAIATVDASGNITAISAGETTITCWNGADHFEAVLKVYGNPTKITAVPESSTISVGGTTNIVLTSDVALTFPYTVTSYNPAVVKVDTNNSLLLHGVSEGTTTVLVMASNGKYASFPITVKMGGGSGTLPVTETATVSADGSVNLHAGKTLTSQIILQIPFGNQVDILQYGPSWCYARYNGYEGYIMTQNLSFGSAPIVAPTSAPGPVMARVSADGAVNLRVAMSLTSDILLQISSGTNVTVLSRGETWSRVTYAGYTGYIMSQYLSFNGSPTGSYAYVNTASGSLNMRKTAYRYAQVIAQIPQYAYVDVYQRGAEWSYVGYNGNKGYCMNSYLVFTNYKPIVTPTPTPGPGGTATVATRSGSLNLRVEPVYGSRILVRIPQYATVSVLSAGKDWCKVSYAGQVGYVMTGYLSFNGSGSKAVVNTRSGSLNLRISPTYGTTILTRIPQYATVSVLDKGSSWCRVTYGSYTGYVMTSYLRFY